VRKGLNPALLGYSLQKPYNNTNKPTYIVLTTEDTKDRTYKKDLLDFLQPHNFNQLTIKVLFKDSNITLNISQPIYNKTFMTLPF
jgi:predicted DNA binding CopG/RHH family protein